MWKVFVILIGDLENNQIYIHDVLLKVHVAARYPCHYPETLACGLGSNIKKKGTLIGMPCNFMWAEVQHPRSRTSVWECAGMGIWTCLQPVGKQTTVAHVFATHIWTAWGAGSLFESYGQNKTLFSSWDVPQKCISRLIWLLPPVLAIFLLAPTKDNRKITNLCQGKRASSFQDASSSAWSFSTSRSGFFFLPFPVWWSVLQHVDRNSPCPSVSLVTLKIELGNCI